MFVCFSFVFCYFTSDFLGVFGRETVHFHGTVLCDAALERDFIEHTEIGQLQDKMDTTFSRILLFSYALAALVHFVYALGR